MSKRLQVIMDDADHRRLRQAARARGVTIAEWVRQVLRDAWRREPTGDVERKLAVVRAAARHEFPAPDVAVMLAEIERGYLEGQP